MATPLSSRHLSGLGVSPGLAAGTAYLYHDILEEAVLVAPIAAPQAEAEFARFKAAVDQVRVDLALTAARVEQEMEAGLAEMFRAHGEMLRDPMLNNELEAEIGRRLVNAEDAVQAVFRRWELRFLAMKEAIYQLRASDIADLGRRLLRALIGVQSHSLERMPEGCVLVAKRLLPSETVFLPRRRVRAIVVEAGGQGSHCALLTRAMGIPAVVNISGLFDLIQQGDHLLVDGSRGVVTVGPDEVARRQFRTQMARYAGAIAKSRGRAHEPAKTIDGIHIPVLANVGCRDDVQTALAQGADGIGLYRIEMYYLGRSTLPDEQELFQNLNQTLEPFRGKPVCVRLLDVGGDKCLPSIPMSSEPNPNLGRRGIRLLLDYPEVLRTQVRALVRLAQGHDLNILIPMVTLADDIRRVRDALDGVASELGLSHLPPLGAMIETPAAAFCVDDIVGDVDFLSLGTNDLTQFMLAADRGNPLVIRYYQDDHRCLFELVKWVCERAQGKLVATCGELAHRGTAVGRLLRAGVRVLSVAPPLVPLVKQEVRRLRAGA